MKNILVSLDFHNEAYTLVEKAKEFGKAFKAKVWLVHIAAPNPDFVGYDVGPQYIRDFRAKELKSEHKKLQDFSTELNNLGIEADGLLIQGATIEQIVDESEKLDIDLIICGHHKHSALYNLFNNETSIELVKESLIPVLTVPFNEFD